MANKVGALIKEARTGAGMTQEQLSKKVDGVTAADISKAERGEKELTQNQLKQIAKATGVTQASLLNAAKEGQSSAAKKTSSTSAAKKTSSTSAAKKTSSTSAAKKTSSTSAAKKTSSTSSAKKTSTSAAKKPTARKEEELKLTAAEKKLLELYRGADKETKEAALKVLKGEKLDSGLLSSILSGAGGGLLDGAMDLLGLGKK